MVVGTGCDSNPARFGQLWLDDRFLQHVPGIPHAYGPIIAAGHSGVSVCRVPLCMCAGTDVAFCVSEIPDVHVTSHTDATLLAIAIIHFDLRGPSRYQKSITYCNGSAEICKYEAQQANVLGGAIWIPAVFAMGT